ncbi:hypothetical protein HN51_036205 [Arachis hypogaea]|nr:Phosphatidylinositol 4-kinase gamma [Arachis hypogaea]
MFFVYRTTLFFFLFFSISTFSLSHSFSPLDNYLHLESEEDDIIHHNFSTPCLPLTTLSFGEDLPSSSHPTEIVRSTGALVHALIVEVAIALASDLHPKPLPNGLGGACLFCNPISSKNIVVVKPVDEEPLALTTQRT